jgi:hypothetical protein
VIDGPTAIGGADPGVRALRRRGASPPNNEPPIDDERKQHQPSKPPRPAPGAGSHAHGPRGRQR